MRILITGGAGSLGKSFVKLLEKHDLIVIDNSEWAIAELKSNFPNVKCVLGDFEQWKYDQDPVDYLIHLAAYKHLPLGEENPKSFIDNNINKTLTLFEEAYKYNVETLFMSTDKAVEPCSLYGYTKAIGESIARHFNFSIARCGNLLNSSGSVIPVWEQQIKDKKPLTITDPEMTRYVIEADEAARQIWDWFYLGDKLIIPQMDRPVRLIDLAETVYKKHKVKPKDQKIQIIGKRPKEKKHERLRWPDEEPYV